MKKTIIFLIFIMLFSFVACGGEGDSGGSSSDGGGQKGTGDLGPAEVTLMSGGPSGEKRFIDQIIADFQKKYPDIKINLNWGTIETGQRLQAIMTALKGKQPDPDCFLMDIAWVGQIAASGWLLDLGPYNIDTSQYFQSIIERADKYNGKLIALPSFVDGGGLYYRTDLLEEYGYEPPELWSDLVEIGQAAQKGERAKGNDKFWGFVWQGKQYEGLICDALEYFASAGGGFMNESGEPIFDTPENKKALQFMHDLIHKYEISPPNVYTEMKEEEARMMFQLGNAMFERNWPYAWTLHQTADNTEVSDKFAIKPLPHFPGEKSASCLGGWHIGASTFSDAPAETVEFMKHYTGYEANILFAVNVGWNPARLDVYEASEIKENKPHMIELKELFKGAIPRPSVPYYTQMSDVMQKYFNSAIAGSMSVDEALQKTQTDVKKLMQEYE